MNPTHDFESFKNNNRSLFFKIKEYKYSEGQLDLDSEFKTVFKCLSNLLQQARVLDIRLDSNMYKLLSWTDKEALEPYGILVKFEDINANFNLIYGHKLLLKNMGGIYETYNQRDEFYIAINQNFIFLQSEYRQGLYDDRMIYEDLCRSQGAKPVDTENWIMFALEANGNRTFYDPVTEKVFLWAPDHNFNFITPLLGQPEYTLYTINGINTFTDYVETLAQQWLEWVL
jgi:hypothetical protein